MSSSSLRLLASFSTGKVGGGGGKWRRLRGVHLGWNPGSHCQTWAQEAAHALPMEGAYYPCGEAMTVC